MSSDILAYRVIRAGSLSEYHEQLTNAIISELQFEVAKTQLKKIFSDIPRVNSFNSGCIS